MNIWEHHCFIVLSENPSDFKEPEFATALADVTTQEGAVQVVFHCKVVGTPAPIVKFYKDGKLLRPEIYDGRIVIGMNSYTY